MSIDARLRTAERAAATGDPQASAAALQERLRAGTITPDRIELAAFCGHEGARLLVIGSTPVKRVEIVRHRRGTVTSVGVDPGVTLPDGPSWLPWQKEEVGPTGLSRIQMRWIEHDLRDLVAFVWCVRSFDSDVHAVTIVALLEDLPAARPAAIAFAQWFNCRTKENEDRLRRICRAERARRDRVAAWAYLPKCIEALSEDETLMPIVRAVLTYAHEVLSSESVKKRLADRLITFALEGTWPRFD